MKGTPAPGLGGDFTNFTDPVLNGSGGVAFKGFSSTAAGLYETSGTSLLTIASTLQTLPGLNVNFANFSTPFLNENGTIAFWGSTAGSTAAGIYTVSGGVWTTISAYGQAAPGLTGSISSLSQTIALSDSGSVAFSATATTTTTSATGDYLGTGGTPASVATTLQTAPGTNALFGSFSVPVLNNTGSSAFVESNGSIMAIYTAFGNTLTTVATTLQTAPEIGGNFTFFFDPSINDNGNIAFRGFSGSGKGIFARVGGVLTAIASTARSAPGLAGNFTNFLDPSLSNAGIVAFRGAAGSAQGIYTGTGGALQTIATTSQSAPGLGGVFSSFGKPSVNDLGTTAFLGSTDTGSGIYIGDGQQLITVAFMGQPLAGSTISSITFAGGSDRGGSSQFNNNGQLAYKVTLANATQSTADDPSSIQLFTPTLHFRTPASGAWTTRANWTLGLLPASVHDVVIDPAAALAITGPMLPTTVKSLAINNAGELTLQSTGTITAAGGASTGAAGRLSGSGKLVANLDSFGTIAPGLVSSAGSISITGNVTLRSTAHLAFDLGGLIRKTNYDFFGVTGTLTLGGSLDVSLLGGFTPQVGNTFDLFDSTFLPTGSFASINLPALTGGRTWNTTALSTTGVISVAGLTINPTTYILAASASAATIHAGGSTTITATITNTGAAGTDTLNYAGLSVQASGGTITPLSLANASLANNGTAQSGTATFSSTVSGAYTLAPTVTSALNGTLGTVAANGGVTTASVGVFSGGAKWNGPANAAWGSGANAYWTDTAAAAVHAAPGTFAGFAASDTAVFDATSSALVNLDGALPSLAALSFTGGSHTLARGTGGTLTLNGGASPATVTASGGSDSITAPVQLSSNVIATVTSAADTLTLSGGITGSGKTLTKTGAGKLLLSGAQNYAVLNLDGGTTDITGSFTAGTAVVHANTATKFTTSQTLAALIIGDGVEVTFGDGAGAAFDDASLKTDAALVPEPGSAGLLLLGALGILSRRRRAVR